MELDNETDINEKLKSTDITTVSNTLAQLRENLKNPDLPKNILQPPVLESLLRYLEHPKFSTLALSIIADACMEKNVVTYMIQNNGIASLLRIINGIIPDDFQNRACRALANIAKFEEGFEAVHVLKPVAKIINFLNGSKDVCCQQTVVRTLRILGRTPKTREYIVSENGLFHISQLLRSSQTEVLLCSTKAIAELTENCDIIGAQQITTSLGLLVKLSNFSSQSNIKIESNVRRHALNSIKNVSLHVKLRADLIKVGALKLFVDIMKNSASSELRNLATACLCNCLDHMHMWNNYGLSKQDGLEILLTVLQNNKDKYIDIAIFSSLIPLSFDQGISAILCEIKIINILILKLREFITENKIEHSTTTSSKTLLKKDNEVSISKRLSSENHILFKKKDSPDFEIKLKRKSESSITYFETFPHNLAANNPCFGPTKNIPKYTSAYCNFQSSCGSSSYRSPSSSGSWNAATSPNVYSDCNSTSPVTDQWSPISETNNYKKFCWSPVQSCSENEDNDENIEENREQENFVTKSRSHNINLPNSSAPKVNKILLVNKEDESKVYSFTDSSSDQKSDTNLKVKSFHADNFGKDVPNKNLKSDSSCALISNVDVIKKTSTKKSIPKSIKLPVELSCNRNMIDHQIVTLLIQLYYHQERKIISELINKNYFTVLLEYIYAIKNPHPNAEKILSNLIKNRLCLEKLLQNEFVVDLENILMAEHNPKDCEQCLKVKDSFNRLFVILQEEIDTEYGIGTLCHILITSENSVQLKMIYAASKLVFKKLNIGKILVQANGLKILIDTLKLSIENDSASNAIVILCRFYQRLKEMKTESDCCISKTCLFLPSSKCVYQETSTNISFFVDGIQIRASREIISSKSDYFDVMLHGSFSESHKDIITLTDISAEILFTIFHFLHGCCEVSFCPYIQRMPLSVSVELLIESEKFMLYDVKKFAQDRLCHMLSAVNYIRVYHAGKASNSPQLVCKVIQFLLLLDISKPHMLLKCFYKLISEEGTEDFFNELESLVLAYIIP